jgi:integrase/recombinase XerD
MPLAARRRKRTHQLRIVPERVGGKKRFKLAGYYVDGKRVRKYFDTEAAAKTFVEAERIRRENLGNRAAWIDGALAEDALRAADALRQTPYGVLEAARLIASAHEQLVPFSADLPAAVEDYVSKLDQRRRSTTVNNLVSEFIENRRARGKSPTYLRDLETRLGRFKSTMGESVVSDLCAHDVDAWIRSLNVGPQTQNNFRSVLSAAWAFAVKRGYTSSNIIREIERVDVVRDHVPVFSVDQLTALLHNAPPECVPVLAIGAFAGLRPEEINKLHWENVDLDERTIRVNATVSKTRKKRFAEISHNLAAWLRPYTGKFGPVAPPNLQRLRRATMARAKIAHWPQDVLRHSFASAHYAFHRNPADTAMLLGHRDQDMLLTHYRDLMKRSEAVDYWNILPTTSHSSKIVPLLDRSRSHRDRKVTGMSAADCRRLSYNQKA